MGKNSDELREEQFSNEYRSELADFSLSADEKDRMVARLVTAMGAEDAAPQEGTAPQAEVLELHNRRRPRRHRLAAAAAAAGLALAVGLGGYAYASGQLVSVPDLVLSVFGTAPADTEVVNKVGRPVNAVATHDGVSVSADAIMGDDHSYVVVYSISRTDGQPLVDLAEGTGSQPGDTIMYLRNGSYLVPDVTLTTDGATAQGGGVWLYDADPTDNAIQMVVACGTDTDVIGKTVRTTFLGLTAFDDQQGDLGKVLSGTWKLSFKLDYQSDAVVMTGGQRITLPETQSGATLSQVSVSSVGVSVEYTADATDADDIPADQPNGYWGGPTVLDLGNITVTLRDGTQIQVDGSGGTAREADGGAADCRVTNFLDRVIDPADVASVTVCGITLTPM